MDDIIRKLREASKQQAQELFKRNLEDHVPECGGCLDLGYVWISKDGEILHPTDLDNRDHAIKCTDCDGQNNEVKRKYLETIGTTGGLHINAGTMKNTSR